MQPPPVDKPCVDLPLELWFEIFQFATYVHRSTTLKPMDPFAFRCTSTNVMALNTPALSLQNKIALTGVCKAWRRLAMPLLYQHLVIRSPSRAALILRTLDQSRQHNHLDAQVSNFGQWTRHIEVFTHARGCSNIKYLQTLFSIFCCCPNLRILSGTWIHSLPPEFVDAVASLYGLSLEALYWNETSERFNRQSGTTLSTSATFAFLISFNALRLLDLRHFKPKDPLGPLLPADAPTRPVLPFVQDLILSTDTWSLSTATHISMPRLQSLTIKTSIPDETDHFQLGQFLAVHGSSLRSVDLPLPSPDDELEPDSSLIRRTAKHINPDMFFKDGVCPNLTSIVFPVSSPLLTAHVHKSLRRIGLRGIRADLLYPERPGSAKGHLEAITPERYPNLDLVQTIGYLVEADVDSLVKDVFIWWVEKFERQGINLLDGEGVLWKYTEPEATAEESLWTGHLTSANLPFGPPAKLTAEHYRLLRDPTFVYDSDSDL